MRGSKNIHLLSAIFQDGSELILAKIIRLLRVFDLGTRLGAKMSLRCIHLINDCVGLRQ